MRHQTRTRTTQRRISTLRRQCRVLAAENRELRELLDQERKENESLRVETLTDPLTALYNRTGLRHVWESIGSAVTALIVVDVDRFKQINDRYGHDVGDIILCRIAEAIRICKIVGSRPGGDEFIGLVTDRDPLRCAEHLRNLVSTPVEINGNSITVTVTIGIAMVTTTDGIPDGSRTAYIEQADQALYQGKRSGRNQVHQ